MTCRPTCEVCSFTPLAQGIADHHEKHIYAGQAATETSKPGVKQHDRKGRDGVAFGVVVQSHGLCPRGLSMLARATDRPTHLPG
jgi:hypothetical protein